MDNQRSTRRIKNRVVVYYKKIEIGKIAKFKDEIYYTVEADNSFSFFASLKGLDASFGDLNKAFVVMMKEMDAKLNYIIELLRDPGKDTEVDGFEKSITCDLSPNGLSIESKDKFEIGDYLYLKLFLPIALHHPIKILAKVVRVDREDDHNCVGLEIEDIKTENRELIIHYMIYVERKMAKDRIERNEQ